jgi:hypothetical protein
VSALSWRSAEESLISESRDSAPRVGSGLLVYPADYAALPAPVDVPWQLKPVSSADSGIEVLSDGTPEILDSARHVKGVTPRMLAWWAVASSGR